jgi:hypothetical protein
MGFLSKKFQLNDAHVFHRLLAVRFLVSIIYILLMQFGTEIKKITCSK